MTFRNNTYSILDKAFTKDVGDDVYAYLLFQLSETSAYESSDKPPQ